MCRTRPALVIDVYIPDGDGDATCRRLKSDPRTAAILIVMMSGGGRKGEAQRCIDAGCDEFLLKPVRQAELFVSVSRHLHGGIGRARLDVRVPVVLESEGNRSMGSSVNISLGGMFVEIDRFLQPGTEMLLEFSLSRAELDPALVRGKVAWVNRPGAKIKRDFPAGIGVEFTKMIPEVQNVLGAFLVAAGAENAVRPFHAGRGRGFPPRPDALVPVRARAGRSVRAGTIRDPSSGLTFRGVGD